MALISEPHLLIISNCKQSLYRLALKYEISKEAQQTNVNILYAIIETGEKQ